MVFFQNEIVKRDICEEIKAIFESEQPKPRSYQGVVDYSVRRCDFVLLPKSLNTVFGDFIRGRIEDFYNVQLDSCIEHAPMIYQYPVGVGFVPHHDLVTEVEKERARSNGQPVIGGDFTVILFVNDGSEYEGGELYFPDHNIEFKPGAGSVVAFPITEEYVHGIKPITHGVRCTVVCRMNRINYFQ